MQAPIASASDRIAAAGSHLPLHELPPAEDGVGAQRIEPRRPSRTSRLSSRWRSTEPNARRASIGIAALLDRFRDVRLQALRRFRGSIDRREIHLRCATTTTYHTVLSTRFTAEVTACQRDSSAASCFLPAAVSS